MTYFRKASNGLWLKSSSGLLLGAGLPENPNPTNLVHGEIFTIHGSGFGSSAVTPLKYDDFSGGTLGNTIGNGWNLYNTVADPDNPAPTYSNTRTRGVHTKVAKVPMTTGPSTGIGIDFPALTNRFYLSYHINYDAVIPPSDGAGWKMLDIRAITPNSEKRIMLIQGNHGSGTWQHTNAISGNRAVLWTHNGNPYNHEGPTSATPDYRDLVDSWNHVEMQFAMDSSMSAGNGHCKIWFNSAPVIDGINPDCFNHWILWDGLADPSMTGYLLDFIIGQLRSTVDSIIPYISCIYVHTSWQRLMLGNASTFAACTQTEVQPFTLWDDDEISFIVNQGEFSDGQEVWPYPVHDDGTVVEGLDSCFFEA